MTYAAEARFGNYTPASFGWAARDPFNDSSLLVPFSHSGARFGRMHRDVVPVFTALLDELVPLIPDGLTVHNDEGCYNPGSVTVGGDRSFHTYGIAIDVNWTDNPMYVPTRPTGPDALPAVTSQIARKYGCEWGGDWSYPQDWMHIECHLTPERARAVRPLTTQLFHPKEDDMGAPVSVTQTKHPTKGTLRWWVTGPHGVYECSKAEAAGICATLGIKQEECSEAAFVSGRKMLTKALLG